MELTKLRLAFDKILGYSNTDLNNRLWNWIKEHSAEIANLESNRLEKLGYKEPVSQGGAVAEVNKILLDAIKDFTDKEKIIFSLRYIKGMTLEEIGKVFNCTVGDALNMIEVILKKLMKATASL